MFGKQFAMPKPSIKLAVSVLVFGMAGAGRGLDEGTISGLLVLPSFRKQFGLSGAGKTPDEVASLKSNIAAMVQLGSIVGALLASLILDRIGRVRSLQCLLALWLIGSVLQITTFSAIAQLYTGRFIAGLGLGMTAVTCPTYLTEIAPPTRRGLCTCLYSGSVYLGIALGYFVNWGTMEHINPDNRLQWVLPVSMQLMLCGLLCIFSPFTCESPRWLLSHGNDEKGIQVLAELRGSTKQEAALGTELSQIYAQLAHEESEHANTTKWEVLKSLFVDKKIRFRFILGMMVQILGQWSGSNAVTMYAPDMFRLVGISNRGTDMLCTSMFGVVKMVASLACGLFIIDKLGRKRALYSGISTQMVSLAYICIFLRVRRSIGDILPVQRAGIGSIIMIYMNGIGWALGWNSVQYLLNAEMFPISSRSMASSIIMCFHFTNQYANSRATPLLLITFKGWGTMLFFALVCLLGLIFSYFLIPELCGLSLESIDELFANPWWKIGHVSRTNRKESAKVIGSNESQDSDSTTSCNNHRKGSV